MTREVVKLEAGAEALLVLHRAGFEIDIELIISDFGRSAHELCNLSFAQNYGKYSILRAIVGEDVRERRRDHCTETIICERPHGVFARGATTEVLGGDQNTCTRVAWFIQNEIWIGHAFRRSPPIIEEKFSESGALNPL